MYNNWRLWSLVAGLILLSSSGQADTLKIVNWNLEYFGENNSAAASQAEMDKVRTIMNQLDADVYGLVEVVSIDSLASLASSLPGDYHYVVSPYGSAAPNPFSNNYALAQKLAFVYKRNKFTNLRFRGFLQSSSSAYTNWSSGRFPFMMEADWINDKGQSLAVKILLIHAKAMNDYYSCDRRVAACRELKDSLDANYPNDYVMIVGDYNDDFDVTICINYSVSNYERLIKDSLDAVSYYSPTIPLTLAGEASIEGYPSFLDHVVVTNEWKPWYITGSAVMLKQQVGAWVSNYYNDVSDHYPVVSSYIRPGTTGVELQMLSAEGFTVYPNPARAFFTIRMSSEMSGHYVLQDLSGRMAGQGDLLAKEQRINTNALPSGLYLLTVTQGGQQKHCKLVITHE